MKTLIRNFVIVMILIALASCNDFLEQVDRSNLTADVYYSTEEGMEALINSTYTPLKFWYTKEDGIAITETGTDLFTRGNGMENPSFALYNSDLKGDNEQLNFLWERFYSALNTCNTAISRLPDSPLSEDEINVRLGEVHFLRAFYLWHIVELWGGVVLNTEPVEEVQRTAERSTEGDFYNQILEDLTFSKDNLPITQEDYGRATKPAAEALMARIYLILGDNENASKYAKKVINDYNFQLLDSYSDLWESDDGRNDEVVFPINFASNLLYNKDLETPEDGDITVRDGGNNSHLFFLMTYDQLPGMERDIKNGRPFARFMPTAHFLDMFDKSIDSRYDTTFQTVWYSNDPDSGPDGMKLGDTAIYATEEIIPQSIKDHVNYTVIDRGRTYDVNNNDAPRVRDRYVSLQKFQDESRPTVSEMSGKKDAYAIRLAEMYLIVAEAEMDSNLGEALNYFNKVRRRAAKRGKESEMEVQDLNIDLILDERGRELAGEQLRWFDLKRTGKLIERVQKWNPDAAPNIQAFHKLLPIPQRMLDAVENKEEFTQNEGYN